MTQQTQQKFINNRPYRVVGLNGAGGRKEVAPGAVVGPEFASLVNQRKGLVPYDGPRPLGQMQKSGKGAPKRPKFAQMLGANDDAKEARDRAQKAKAIAGGEAYMDQSYEEWCDVAAQGKLESFSRSQLLGLGRFVGIDFAEATAKKDIIGTLRTKLAPGK